MDLEQLNNELVDALSNACSQLDEARVLLQRAGFPPPDAPAFVTARAFWHAIVQSAGNGKLRGGVQVIVDEAVRQYPGNGVFTGYASARSRLGRSSRTQAPGEPDTPPFEASLRSSCAELFIEPNGRAIGLAQAIASNKLLTCAHFVANTNTVWLKPLGSTSKVEATVIRDAVDAALDAALLHCPQWEKYGNTSPVSREPPAIGAKVKGFFLRESQTTENQPDSCGIFDAVYFGFGDGRRVMVRGCPSKERFRGTLLYDSESGLAWGLATASAARSTNDLGEGLDIATSIGAILGRFDSYLGIEPEKPRSIDQCRALGEHGWALLWHTGTTATNRTFHQHLPFFVEGDSPSPDDIARGEAYPRRAAVDLVEFFSTQPWEAPRCGIITGEKCDGKTTLGLLTAWLLHERGTQVLFYCGSGVPDLHACADVVKAAPILFLIERPPVGVGWYHNLSVHLAYVHAATGHPVDALLIVPPSDLLNTEYSQFKADMRESTPKRLLKVSAVPTYSEIEPSNLYQHVKRVYATRAYSCRQELEAPFDTLQKVLTSRGLLRRLFRRLSKHAGVPASPLQRRPGWLTPSLVECVTLTSSLGLTLPWSLARTIVPDIPTDLENGEYKSIGWHERGLHYGHSEQTRRPDKSELNEIIGRVLALALRVGDSEFIGALTLALLQDPEAHETTQQFIKGQLDSIRSSPPQRPPEETSPHRVFRGETLGDRGIKPPGSELHPPRIRVLQPMYAQMLWSTYLSCSDDELRRSVVLIGFALSTDAPEETRMVFARILFADAWRTFRNATKPEPGSRISPKMRDGFRATLQKLENLTLECSSEDVRNLSIQTEAILRVVDMLVGDAVDSVDEKILHVYSRRALDDYWSMVLRAFEFLVDEFPAKDLLRVFQNASLSDRGAGVHERLARGLFKLYLRSDSVLERDEVLQSMERSAHPTPSGSELRATLARTLYMEHLESARAFRRSRAWELYCKLESLYNNERDALSIRFHFLGAVVNEHLAAIHQHRRHLTADLVSRAQTIARLIDPPEVRSRLSVILYNAHLEAFESTSIYGYSLQWLMLLRETNDKEDASPRSRLLYRKALADLRFQLHNAPFNSRDSNTITAQYNSLSNEERTQVDHLVATTKQNQGWVTLSDARWETPTDEDATVPEIIRRPNERGRITNIRTAAMQARRHDACIVVIHGVQIGRRYIVERREMTIGRATVSDICLNYESVSRTHAIISAGESGVGICDNGSTNGTFVNDQKISEAYLRDGDLIQVGRSIFKFLTGDNIESSYHEEIYRLSTIDVLTQLFNKRYFTDTLAREFTKTRQCKQSLALIMLDIDRLRHINEMFGDRAGDRVLCQVGEIIRDCAGARNVVADYGGGKFAALLLGIEFLDGARLGDRIRGVVEQHDFGFKDHYRSVTVSVAVAAMTADIITADELSLRAETYLRRAKDLGGNCIVPTGDGSS